MDNFRKGTSIPCCRLTAKVMGRGAEIPSIDFRVKLKGAKPPHDIFTIVLPAEGTDHGIVIVSCYLLPLFQILILKLQILETYLQQVYIPEKLKSAHISLTVIIIEFSISIIQIVQVPLPVGEVDWMHLNHLLLVHPQLVHLQPMGWIQNSVSGNQKNFVRGWIRKYTLQFSTLITTKLLAISENWMTVRSAMWVELSAWLSVLWTR